MKVRIGINTVNDQLFEFLFKLKNHGRVSDEKH